MTRQEKISKARNLSVQPNKKNRKKTEHHVIKKLDYIPKRKFLTKRDTFFEKIEDIRQELIPKRTYHERLFDDRLTYNGIEFEVQKFFGYGGKFMFVDFFIPSLNLCVEIDGGYHRAKKTKQSDRRKNISLNERGFGVLRISNSDSEEMTDDLLIPLMQSVQTGTKYSPNYRNYK